MTGWMRSLASLSGQLSLKIYRGSSGLCRTVIIGAQWLPGERPRVQIRPKACHNVVTLYIYPDLSSGTCFLGCR